MQNMQANSLSRVEQNINLQLYADSNNQVFSDSTEQQIIADEQEIFFTLNNSKKLSDYLDNNDTAMIVIPPKYQQSLQQCIDIKNNAEFFKVFNEFIQTTEFNSIVENFIADLNLLKQFIGFYLKDNPSCNGRQRGIDNLIAKLKNTAEYELQKPNTLLEMFSSARENIHIIVTVISKLKIDHENINSDTAEEQINHSKITSEGLTELIIEYCDMFDACWAGVSFRTLTLKQGLKDRLSGKLGVVSKVKSNLLIALSTQTEQQLIATGDRKNNPGMSVHVVAYFNYQIADKFGTTTIKDVYINDDPVNAVVPNNGNKPTTTQVDEYKKTAEIALSAYNINFNLASNLLDGFNTLMELYGGFQSGYDIYFNTAKITEMGEQEKKFLFNDLNAGLINPTNLLYETTNHNTLFVNDLIEDTIENVDYYIFKDILSKLQGFTAQALLSDESQRLIMDIPQELNDANKNLAIAAIGSCYFWVVDKNQLLENQPVKLNLSEYIKLEVSHIPKNLVNEISAYFYCSLVTQALQQTKDAQAILDFIDRCDINEYLQQDVVFKQHINQIISNKTALNPELKNQLIECIFCNGNYIENGQFKFSYANWFIESTLCEPLAMFFAVNSINIIDFINQLSIKTILQLDNKLSLNHLCLAALEQAIVTFDKKYFNDLFNKLMKYGNSPVILKLFHSGLIDLDLDNTFENSSALLKILIKNKDTDGINLLIYLIKQSKIQYIDINLNKILNKNKILFNIARYGKEADIEAIINLNQILLYENKINYCNLNNACIEATYHGNTEVLKHLVRLKNFNPNAQLEDDRSYRTALIIACIKGNTECANLLLHSGQSIDINIKDYGGNTALMHACNHEHVECVKLLLNSGKNININQQNHIGSTALMIACDNRALLKHPDKRYLKCVKLLFDFGKNINLNIQNKFGTSALILACCSNELKCVKLFLNSSLDIDLNLKDIDNNTILMMVCTLNHLECLKLLLNYYENINMNHQDNDGRNALMIACDNGYLECLKLLLSSDLDINLYQKDNYGNTAVMLANKNGHTACADFLVNTINSSCVNKRKHDTDLQTNKKIKLSI